MAEIINMDNFDSYGLDVEQELIKMLSKEVAKEIAKEIAVDDVHLSKSPGQIISSNQFAYDISMMDYDYAIKNGDYGRSESFLVEARHYLLTIIKYSIIKINKDHCE